MRVICDTGIISRMLTNEVLIINFVYDKIGFDNIVITPVIKIELLNWISGYKNLTQTERAIYLKFIRSLPIIHISKSISKLAVEMSDKSINSKPADTLIGATAKYHNIPIYTINKKDFETLNAPVLG